MGKGIGGEHCDLCAKLTVKSEHMRKGNAAKGL